VVTSLLLNYVASSVGNSVSFNILHAVYISSIQLWYPWYFSIIEEITGEIFCEDSGIVIRIQILEDRPRADSFLTWTHGTLNR